MRGRSRAGPVARLGMLAACALTVVAVVVAAATTMAADGNDGSVPAALTDRVLVADGGFGVPRLIAAGAHGVACVSGDRDVLSFGRYADRRREATAAGPSVIAGDGAPRKLLGRQVYCSELATASDGTAIVAGQSARGVVASVRRPGGDFGRARLISADSYVEDLSVAAARGGWTAVAWQRSSSARSTLRLRITAPDGSARSGSIATSKRGGSPLNASSVAVDGAGGAIVATTRGEQFERTDVLASVVAPGATPGSARRIGRGVQAADIDYEVAPVAVATDPDGHIVASWVSASGLVTATGTTRAGLDAPRHVRERGAAGSPVVRVNGTGAAIVAYGDLREDGDPTVNVIGRSAPGSPFAAPYDVLDDRPTTQARSSGDGDGGESPGSVLLDATLGEDGRAAVVFNGYVDDPSPAGEYGPEIFGVSLAATRAADGTWRTRPLSRPSRSSEGETPVLGLGPQGAPRAYYVEESLGKASVLKMRELWPAAVPPDTAPPVVTASLAPGARAGSKGIGPVRIRVRCDEACDALAELGQYELTVRAALRGGVQSTLALTPRFKDLSRIRFTAPQRRAGRARLVLRLVVSDALGNTRVLRQSVAVKI
jgi:hypothetical protein